MMEFINILHSITSLLILGLMLYGLLKLHKYLGEEDGTTKSKMQ